MFSRSHYLGKYGAPRFYQSDPNPSGPPDDPKADPPGDPKKDPPKGKDFVPPQSQEDLDAIIARRVSRALEKSKKETADELRESIRKEIEDEGKEAELKEHGKFKDLYEKSEAKVVDLQKQIDDLKGNQEKQTIAQMRTAAAKKYNLPDGMDDRLVGDDEAAIEADAKAMAAKIKAPPPSTEGGSGGGRNAAAKSSAASPAGTYRYGGGGTVVPFPDKAAAKRE